jgi:hypothetical protein
MGVFNNVEDFSTIPPLPKVLKTEREVLSNTPPLNAKFLKRRAFLENSGLLVKNCD